MTGRATSLLHDGDIYLRLGPYALGSLGQFSGVRQCSVSAPALAVVDQSPELMARAEGSASCPPRTALLSSEAEKAAGATAHLLSSLHRPPGFPTSRLGMSPGTQSPRVREIPFHGNAATRFTALTPCRRLKRLINRKQESIWEGLTG